MKKFVFTILPLFISICLAFGQNEDFVVLYGKVLDSETSVPVSYASVSLSNSQISNITNSEGVFSLKIPVGEQGDVKISHLGYSTQYVHFEDFSRSSLNDPLLIRLFPVSISLDAATIKSLDAEELLRQALRRIDFNNSRDRVWMTAFYREMIRRGNGRYMSLNEAIVDIDKTPYNGYASDRSYIYKGRGNVDYDVSDTLILKYQAGIYSSIAIDQAKNPLFGYDLIEEFKLYDFWMEPSVMIDNSLFYVVGFNQREDVEDMLYRGKFYLDSESLAIARVEFNANVEGREDAYAVFIRKKPAGIIFDIDNVSYIVNYRENDGIWYFDYSRTEMNMSTRKKASLFKRNFTIVSEIAVTDTKFEALEVDPDSRVRYKDILSDKVSDFTDPDFWGSYNIIEPDETIDVIIKRIVRQLERR